jgi:three-Cys-motif partner protein
VRPSGPWAVEKLTYVAKYQDIFATGMKKWRDRFYVDLLAGPGRCINRESSEEFDGSPVRSLGVRFTTRIFIEADPLLASALRTRVGVGPILIADDCTKSTVIEQVRKETSGRDRLGLAFVDNLGLDVPFATLAALTSDRRIDLMITFQVGDLTRNIPNVLDGREDPGRFDRFFGSTGWQAVAAESMRRNASAGETATVLLDFYARQLETLGYPHLEHSHRLMRNSRNVPQYRLLLAGKNEKAVEFFRKIQAIDPSGQRRLL